MSGSIKKVCHITTVHPRYDIRIFYKECISLTSDYVVNLIVADGKGDEVKNEVNIIDVLKGSKSRIKRIFIVSHNAYKKALALDCDLYHFHDPEFMFYGLMLKLKGKHVIYDVHEDLPNQVLSKAYLHPIFRKIISRSVTFFEKHISGKLSSIVTVTQTINNRFSKYNSECNIINNYPRLDEFVLSETTGKKKDEVCYVGGITRVRGIEELVDAIENTDLSLTLAGNFESDEFRTRLINKTGWKRVNYLGYITPKETYAVMSRSLAGISTLYPEPNYLTSQATKIFEYMYAGIPVIASNFPQWVDFIEKHKCGICVNPKDPVEISAAMSYLENNPDIAEKMGANGKNAVTEFYSWTSEEEKLLEIYFKILNN